MNHSEQRRKLRAILAGTKCLSPASVFDPLSARVAETIGYEIGLLGGSVASYTTLAAPDIIVMTLTELADQTRRIMRVSKLSLIVDADHGFGNALNAMRTVQELEHAGASALTIEDTVLPTPFGQEGKQTLTSIDEAVGKLRAAIAGRNDPSLIIAARTSALKLEGLESVVARATAYAKTGADVLFVNGFETLEQLDAIRSAMDLPMIIAGAPTSLKREDLAVRGARLLLKGHQPVAAAVKALQETYTHLYNDGVPATLLPKIASPEEMEQLINAGMYKKWRSDYLN